MAISQKAQRNHDAPSPNHVSTLKATDPELLKLAITPGLESRRSLGVSRA